MSTVRSSERDGELSVARVRKDRRMRRKEMLGLERVVVVGRLKLALMEVFWVIVGLVDVVLVRRTVNACWTRFRRVVIIVKSSPVGC